MQFSSRELRQSRFSEGHTLLRDLQFVYVFSHIYCRSFVKLGVRYSHNAVQRL
jgi:hypothetical protein